MPARHPSRSANYKLTRARAMKWQTKFQGGIMAWFLAGVTAVCDKLGGNDFRDQTTLSQRRELWNSLFDQSPILIAQGTLSTIKGSVPIEDIFSGKTAEQLQWQIYIKTSFIWASEDTYRFRYKTDNKTECFTRWCSLPMAAPIAELNLGGIDMVPFQGGRRV